MMIESKAPLTPQTPSLHPLPASGLLTLSKAPGAARGAPRITRKGDWLELRYPDGTHVRLRAG